MGLIIRGTLKSNDYALTPAGSHPAVCYSVIDLGTQRSEYQGQVKQAPKVRISWEIPSERTADGRPMSISKTYTASLDKKSTLRKDLQRWRDKDFTETEINNFDAKSLLGKVCVLSIQHAERAEKTYANVEGILSLPKGMERPAGENPLTFFDLSNFDRTVFDKLPQFLKEQIAKSPEFQALGEASQSSVSMDEDDIPF